MVRLADFIDQNMPTIVSAWESFAATLLPAASDIGPAGLRDHSVQILQAVVKDLRTTQSREEQAVKSMGQASRPFDGSHTAAQTHAVLRAASGFTMQQLVAEYRALRSSVLQLWADAQPPGTEALQDIGRFNEAIDQAIAESVDFFSREVDRWRHVFLGVLGHDLRGPLNAMLLTSQLLLKLGAGTPLSQPTERLLRSGERMKALLDDLLDYSRTSLELGLPVSPAFCDLADACQEEVELQRAALPDCRIAYAAQGPTQGTWDASRIRQIVGNLVTNAARYGSPGGPVTVKLDGSETEVRLSVENPGPTIPQETIQSLFEPLRRGAGSDVDAGRTSMGLGLFIVRQVALAHGGTVTVDSANGRTVFEVVLPRVLPGQA